MSTRLPRLAVALVTLLVAGACGGSGNPTGPGGGGSSPMTARVDGQNWTALDISVAAIAGGSGLFTITGSETNGGVTRSITLAVYNVRGTGTYALGVFPNMYGGTGHYTEASVVWATPFSGAAGSVTITTLTPTRIAGTFQFMADLSSGGSGTASHTISNGIFDITMNSPSGTLPTVPADAGAVVTATIGANAFNAATASATTSIMGNGLGFNASNQLHQITLSLAGITTAGTYTLNQPGGRLLGVTGLGPSSPQCCWGLNAGDVGTITISSVTADRLVGTFSATLQPQAGSGQTQPLTISGGTFDIGR